MKLTPRLEAKLTTDSTEHWVELLNADDPELGPLELFTLSWRSMVRLCR